MSYNDFLTFAHTLADASASVIRSYYRNVVEAAAKADKSLVTIADQEAEQAMRALIEAHYPEHGIVGEEADNVGEERDYVWVLDPIDGTSSFVIGRPIFGTLIALLYKGKPVLGVINQPITHERWVAAEAVQTGLNDKPVKVRTCAALQDAILTTTSPEYFQPQQKHIFDAIAARAKQTVYGGDCYQYALLASGTVDLVIETGLKLHDFAALKVIVEQAGGVISDWQGNPLHAGSDGTVIAAVSEALHLEVLALVKSSIN